ncbi:T6SS phospholipase effector Tle1-like catalytic domain-containing protein [Pseudacidovorax intermedius]|nr:DUF2235 domain-containing protein [Pseudacidovorax intermedius]
MLETMKRIESMPYAPDFTKRPDCSTVIHVGIFFDGTNNNKQRDQVDVLAQTGDANRCSHSNVVVLHDAFKLDPENGYYRFYIPGVGTPCPEVNERAETPSGKSQATGGDARINWALLQVLNAMHRSLTRRVMFENKDLTRHATTYPLHAGLVPHANMDGKRLFFQGAPSSPPGEGNYPPTAPQVGKLQQLQRALEDQGPQRRLAQVNLHVFGFSRGAAQARAFCHFVHHILLQSTPQGYTLAGVPLRIAFLGLFDTVASVGLADSSPFWRGLGGWANGTLAVPPSVARTVHLCAAHEIRMNFPLSTAREGEVYPSNCIERVYPGAHSNVGGGYDPGCQGKASGSRAKLLSQVPLLDMYRQAILSSVPLQSVRQLRQTANGDAVAADLEVHPDCLSLFNAYRAYTAEVNGSVEDQLRAHMRIYWRWRLQYMGAIDHLPSYQQAGAQDKIDMWESEGDFTSDVFKALAAERLEADPPPDNGRPLPRMLPEQRDFLKVRADMLQRRDRPLPPDICRFFDEMVHDSHASFYMLGPLTQADRREKIAQVARKVDSAQHRLQELVKQGRMALTPEQIEAAAVESLSQLELRIHAYQQEHPGEYPLVKDADRKQLLAMEDLVTSGAVRLVTNDTRRELGGHVRYRRVFDRS